MTQLKNALVHVMHDRSVTDGNHHLAAICQIAMHGHVLPDTYARLQEQPRAVMAEQYGVDSSGVAQMAEAQGLAEQECLRFLEQRQEAQTVPLAALFALLRGHDLQKGD